MPITKTSKEEVLQTVIPILRERGICKSSMSELAKACGIQKSHFYYYFSNKEQLIKEVLSTVNSYFKYNLFKVIENNDLTTKQKLDKLRKLIDKMFRNANSGCIMANTALETAHLNPVYKDEIKHFFEDFINGLQILLAPNYSKQESLALAEQMVQDLEGGILLMRIYNDHKYINNAVSRMEKIILKA
ncbi:TetR/AcrR family transcriptional regulator [Aquimarina sp. 2201CG14-23]|uniref:TetR/AcrR family transcriptional regulator n=1 Tax=Aquimarina mycalae TaxID=3040073 RepID=UPI002478186A|nr:TetR/AcrR family transcriptional regulator [Aquimarina sp. 2201CG14-23]MDH7445766.1 TetR/AcrR family transcriptional regulator [Aquimarina sp. 2201CG14-23]